MPTNVFFNHAVKSEQNLVEDLVVESLRFYGHSVYYLPRKIVTEDMVLGEAPESTFDDAYEIEMYLEGVEGCEGEGDLYTRFGVEVRDSATFVISRRSWERFVSLDINLATGLRPNEGDLIYFPLSKSLFEIRFVEHENPFYQLGKLFVFKMTCDLFEYSGEAFDTGVATLDTGVELAQAQAIDLILSDNTARRAFVQGENISQEVLPGVIVTGTVSAWSEGTNKVTISSISSNSSIYKNFLATDTSIGDLQLELTEGEGKILLQDGDGIDFEDGTEGVIFPSYITDGTTGTDNVQLQDGGGITLEVGTSVDSTPYDTLICEDSIISRRTVVSVGSDQELTTDAGAFNLEIETEGDSIIDFSESNPFGDVT